MSDNTNLDISILERAVAGFDLVLTDTQKTVISYILSVTD